MGNGRIFNEIFRKILSLLQLANCYPIVKELMRAGIGLQLCEAASRENFSRTTTESDIPLRGIHRLEGLYRAAASFGEASGGFAGGGVN